MDNELIFLETEERGVLGCRRAAHQQCVFIIVHGVEWLTHGIFISNLTHVSSFWGLNDHQDLQDDLGHISKIKRRDLIFFI